MIESALARQVVVVAMLLGAGALSWFDAARSQPRRADLGFWFEEVAFESVRLGGALTAADVATIRSTAASEVAHAFDGLAVHISDRRDARYRVRVVQEVRDLRFRRAVGVAGESRAVTGFGGSGSVSFFFLASSAMAYAPPGADRAALLAAIGRGVGRSAVHEFTHQLLPTAPIHASKDAGSYEYASAARPAQYVGSMHWDLAWPLLRRKVGASGRS